MSSAGTIREERPFLGGMVDVFPPDQLKPNQSPDLRDLTLHQGVALERGGWGVIGQAAVFGATNYLTGKAVLLPDQTTADYVITAAGKVGIATSGGRNGDATDSALLVAATTYYPGPVWQGEQLILPQDGESPILLFAGNLNTLTLGAGTVTTVTGSNRVEGSGTSFSSNWINAYIRVIAPSGAGYVEAFHRIVAVESTTRLTVAGTFAVGVVATTFGLSRFGRMGLHAVVTNLGTDSITNGSTTVTGKGTKWNSTPSSGYGRPAFFAGGARSNVDLIMARTDSLADFGGSLRYITTVGSDTSITVSLQMNTTISDVNYRISRPMPGTVACAHENRLYITGVNWRKRTLFISPPGYLTSTIQNDEQSFSADRSTAILMADQDVPGPDVQGTLNALLSLPSGALLILSDVDAHIGWGEYPSFSTQKVADHGCFGQRAALAVDEGAWFAGPEGVFEVQGNRPVNIIEDQLGRLWDTLMKQTPITSVLLGMVDNHLFVVVHTASTNSLLVWDRQARVWCGQWVTNIPTGITWLDSARIPGQPDRLLMSHADDQLADLSTTIFHGDTPSVTTNPGRFRAVTPSNIAGSTGKLKRVRGVKVGYVLQGTGACTLDVSTALTPDATPAIESQGSLPVGNAYDLTHKRVRPVSGNLGRESREFTMMLERSASPTTVARVAVHDLELVVSERTVRA